jgi:hypothetical protein
MEELGSAYQKENGKIYRFSKNIFRRHFVKKDWGNLQNHHLSPVYTTLNFWYGTDKIGTRTTFLVLGLPI